jgi:SWI/SNF-related matrix-associated actin-dependent regulator 1 of chromatin subfamily A
MLERGIMIRRLKSEVLKELPAKRRQKIVVSTDPHTMRKIGQILKRIKNWDDKIKETGQKGDGMLKALAEDFDQFIKGADINEDPTLQAIDDKYSYLLNAYSLTGLAKVRGVIEFLENLIENKVKFIIFAHHYDVMDAIEDFVVKKKIAYIRIDGQIEATKRYEAVRKF